MHVDLRQVQSHFFSGLQISLKELATSTINEFYRFIIVLKKFSALNLIKNHRFCLKYEDFLNARETSFAKITIT